MMLVVILLSFSIVISNKEPDTKVSFKESMDLVGYPIITFYIGEKKLNFILDTGSNSSFINQNSLTEDLNYKALNKGTVVTGFQSDAEVKPYISFEFYYKTCKFEDEFCVVNLSQSFDAIKKESGVVVHGLLGSKFFQKYKYILDFDELIAYHKK